MITRGAHIAPARTEAVGPADCILESTCRLSVQGPRKSARGDCTDCPGGSHVRTAMNPQQLGVYNLGARLCAVPRGSGILGDRWENLSVTHMAKRIIITGATGFIGRALCRELHGGYEVVALSRDATRAAGVIGGYAKVFEWDARTASVWSEQVEGAHAIINLAGESVAQGRWTQARRDSIMQSRTNSANAIVDAVAGARNKPAVVIQGSAVGYYGSRGDEILHGDSPPGRTFLADVCRRVESIGAGVERSAVRYVAVRTGMVLGLRGGALPRLMMPFRFFLGGRIGSGKQWLSWISLEDEVQAIRFLVENPSLRGSFNLTSPYPVMMKQFVRILGQVLHRPAWTTMPGFVVRLALGQMADEVLLASCRAIPRRLIDAGFEFKHPELKAALEAIIQGEDHESD